MNSVEIARVLSSHPKTKENFKGVYALDTLPKIFTKHPVSLVVNTDPVTKPGTHWLALYMATPHSCEYFDSYGLPPFLLPIMRLMQKYKNVYFNKTTVQSPMSDACGEFCICFILARSVGHSMRQFLQMFADTLVISSDMLVKLYVRGL